MRRTWVGLATLAGLALAMTGCYSTTIKRVKRPTLVQEYRLPPEDDPRFSQPPTLPNKVMLGDTLGQRRDGDNPARQLQQPMTAPGRMGGMMP